MYEISRYYSGRSILLAVREDGEFLGNIIVRSKTAADRFTKALNEASVEVPACEGSELPDAEYPTGSAYGTAA